MFLFILESIGTSELLLIATVALIVFGPRKLPQMAKTIGKTMAEFKNATNEFKSTWEKEVSFEDNEVNPQISVSTENNVSRTEALNKINSPLPDEEEFSKPIVTELSTEDVARRFPDREKLIQNPIKVEKIREKAIPDKRDWL